jgi:hypothetical protein
MRYVNAAASKMFPFLKCVFAIATKLSMMSCSVKVKRKILPVVWWTYLLRTKYAYLYINTNT